MEPIIFDHEKGIPIYRQLAEYFKVQISKGIYRPGDLLPSEAEQVRDLKVSRTTVRLASGLLNNAGLIRQEQGRGTIVISQIRSKLPMLSSFTEEVERLGYTPGMELLSQGEEKLSFNAANALDLNPGKKVIKVVRLRLADNKPIGIATTWLNNVKYPDLEDIDYRALSLYQVYENQLGLIIKNAIENVQADIVDEHEISRLKIAPGSPVQRITRTTFAISENEFGVPIEYVEAVFNAAVYSVDIELFRRKKM